MTGKTYYITTPIYYPSDYLHIGNTYCTVAADVMARFRRMQGYDVMFLTGTDDHGQKIETRAKQAGVSPKEFVDNIVDSIQELWKLLLITNDKFIRTTDDYHMDAVQKIFKELYDRGDIYKGHYEGMYCTPCESFWTKTQLKDGNCPDCGRPASPAKEEAYFFRLSRYQERLISLYKEHPEFLEPESRRNEMLQNFLLPGLEDLCVSRTSFNWGVPVPFDDDHVIYVWIDALPNYITALGYVSGDDGFYKKFWPADVHLIGKEIVRFHAIIWPAILMALELPLPKRIYGHGWITKDGQKIGKSMGNAVDPVFLANRYGVDALRYFIMREFPLDTDGNYTNEQLLARLNSDLANDLGNLLSRTVAMAEKYFGGVLPPSGDRKAEDIDRDLISCAAEAAREYAARLEGLEPSYALAAVWRLISRANKYIDETQPWVLARDEKDRPRLAAVIYNLCEALRIVGILVSPVMPISSEKILGQLGVPEKKCSLADAAFGDGTVFAPIRGEALFARIDVQAELESLKALAQTKAREYDAQKGEIDIDDFIKTDLRVAKVLECEPVPKSDKLLRIIVDLGYEKRQIVSGIAQYYKPEELIGKKIIVVANLKPVKLRGVESAGMLLAADTPDGGAAVVFAPDVAEPGLGVH